MFPAKMQNFLVYIVEQGIIYLALLRGVCVMHLSSHT